MFSSQWEWHLELGRVNEERSAIMGLRGQEGTVVYGKAAGTGRPVAGKDNNEARTEGGKKLILKGCLGKHRAMQKLFALPYIGDVVTVGYVCVFVFANSGVAIQISKKIKVSVTSWKWDISWLHSHIWETNSWHIIVTSCQLFSERKRRSKLQEKQGKLIWSHSYCRGMKCVCGVYACMERHVPMQMDVYIKYHLCVCTNLISPFSSDFILIRVLFYFPLQ